jgi:hypothetical protein
MEDENFHSTTQDSEKGVYILYPSPGLMNYEVYLLSLPTFFNAEKSALFCDWRFQVWIYFSCYLVSTKRQK